MKQNPSLFCLQNGHILFKHKKAQHDLFDTVKKMTFVDQRFTASDKLNAIGVSRAVWQAYHKEKLLLLNCDTGEHVDVTLKAHETIGDADFVATSYLGEILDLPCCKNIYLCRYKDLAFGRVYPQKIDHIRESDLVISRADADGVLCELQKQPYRFFEVYNTATHDCIIVKKTHIFVDDSLPAGTVRLSRKQRICLGLELPQYLSDEQWSVLEEQLDRDGEDYKTLCELYTAGDRFLDKNASFAQKTKAKKILSRHLTGEIRIIPIPASVLFHGKSRVQRLCDFYVGKSTISLVGRRPYAIDEGLDIVRMTRSNMNLLGIDEMDKVILQYKNKKVSCRVLELGDEEAFAETNLPISPDLAVGIPAHIRKRLGVLDLSSSVKIDRDTAFIFKKSINEQIVPILLTLFSANLFTDSSVALSALLSLVAIPVVLYFNLSSKRNMRA